MDHNDHVQLIQSGVRAPGGVWADIGAGRGSFTLALAELLVQGHIHAVDQDQRALNELQRRMKQRFPTISFTGHHVDFTRELPLPLLDGIVMANALHFIPHGAGQTAVLRRIRSLLHPGAHFILVEYDIDRGNRWVPHPVSFNSWKKIAAHAGFMQTRLLHSRPSRFLGRIYAAASS